MGQSFPRNVGDYWLTYAREAHGSGYDIVKIEYLNKDYCIVSSVTNETRAPYLMMGYMFQRLATEVEVIAAAANRVGVRRLQQ